MINQFNTTLLSPDWLLEFITTNDKFLVYHYREYPGESPL